MVYRESVRLRGHVTSDVQGSASEKLDITGAESLPSSSRNRRRTKGYSDFSSLFSVAAISLCAGCICCGLALFIFSFWTSSRLQRTPKIDRTALRMAQEAAEQDMSPVLRQPLRRSFDDTSERLSAVNHIRLGELSGGDEAQVVKPEDMEEDAVQEVLREWQDRKGYAEEPGRFRKFKHGERVDDTHRTQERKASKKQQVMFSEDNRPRGVHPSELHRYIKGESTFTCTDSLSELAWSAVNDDYCDCPNGMDEPGTSACSSSARATQFYCGWRSKSTAEARVSGTDVSIFPSRVDDGVCDCCNGADERDTKCVDSCASLVEEERRRLAEFSAGRELRNKYIEEAKMLAADPKFFGRDSAFRPLADECLNFDAGEYRYKVCPFKSVQQIKLRGHGPLVGLGNGHGHWEDDKTLVMAGGTFCGTVHRSRMTRIRFRCGLEDAVHSVEEFETCVYVAEFETPAACF